MSSSTWTLRGDYKQQPLQLVNDDNSTVVLDDTSDSVFLSGASLGVFQCLIDDVSSDLSASVYLRGVARCSDD